MTDVDRQLIENITFFGSAVGGVLAVLLLIGVLVWGGFVLLDYANSCYRRDEVDLLLARAEARDWESAMQRDPDRSLPLATFGAGLALAGLLCAAALLRKVR